MEQTVSERARKSERKKNRRTNKYVNVSYLGLSYFVNCIQRVCTCMTQKLTTTATRRLCSTNNKKKTHTQIEKEEIKKTWMENWARKWYQCALGMAMHGVLTLNFLSNAKQAKSLLLFLFCHFNLSGVRGTPSTCFCCSRLHLQMDRTSERITKKNVYENK